MKHDYLDFDCFAKFAFHTIEHDCKTGFSKTWRQQTILVQKLSKLSTYGCRRCFSLILDESGFYTASLPRKMTKMNDKNTSPWKHLGQWIAILFQPLKNSWKVVHLQLEIWHMKIRSNFERQMRHQFPTYMWCLFIVEKKKPTRKDHKVCAKCLNTLLIRQFQCTSHYCKG